MAKRFRVRTLYTTYIDKVVEANNESMAAERAWCISGDTDAYVNNLDNAQTEVEEVSDSEELTDITADDQRWLDRLEDRLSERAEKGGIVNA